MSTTRRPGTRKNAPELSVAFLEAMNEVVERLAKNPLAFPVRLDDVR
jgi:hypothetical protein